MINWGGMGATSEPATALAVFPDNDPALVELGHLLFYDPILSGNREVSCATCHHPRFATSDGLSLGIGDGGIGLGPDREIDPENPPEQRIPRNATALFNLGAPEFTVMFHDGRLEADPSRPSGLRTPLEDDMVAGFDSVLAAQTMFPVLSPDEMAGHYAENEIAAAVRQGLLAHEGGAWDRIAARVEDLPGYRIRFDAVLGPNNSIEFTDISNALAAFIAEEWRADNSPFDHFLRDGTPLRPVAEAGRELFYGKAGCGDCHAGQFQTDHSFHAIAVPQLGPGKAERFETHSRDIGRMRVTGDPADAYKFRTPSLRNVTETAPYGHSGAYATLEGVVRHHLTPMTALRYYDRSQTQLTPIAGIYDWRALDDPAENLAIAKANALQPVTLTDAEIDQVLAFLASLTDLQSLDGRLGIPEEVPSGLPVER